MKCLDTTLLIDIVAHPNEARGIVERFEQAHETLATTTFNAYEALLGVHSVRDGGQRAKLLDLYSRVLSRLVVLPLSLEDAAKAAELGGELRRRGQDVGTDVLTAAIALRGGCDGILTRNLDHFRRIAKVRELTVVPY